MFPVNITVPYVDNVEQRGYADMIEKLVAEEARKNNPSQFWEARSKRSIEDFTYRDNGKWTYFDVKSYDWMSEFSMPNLISIDRLRKLMKAGSELVYINVPYTVHHKTRTVELGEIEFRPVYTIDPAVLAIQNLGKGVLQVKNMHNSLDRYSGTKDEWMQEISTMAHAFYGKQIEKFKKLQATWC
jgi:hypothetical protein